MMKTLILISLLFPLSLMAQNTGVLEPTENYDYRVSTKGASWVVEISSTSKYKSDGTPTSLSSLVKIEHKQLGGGNGGSAKTTQIPIQKYPNEGGVIYIDVDNLPTPLFILIAKGGELADHQRELFLLSPACKAPLASARAHLEEATQIEVNTGVKDFMISFPGPNGQVKKTWTAPTDSSKLCQQKWQ
jgi:hypothetical protein